MSRGCLPTFDIEIMTEACGTLGIPSRVKETKIKVASASCNVWLYQTHHLRGVQVSRQQVMQHQPEDISSRSHLTTMMKMTMVIVKV